MVISTDEKVHVITRRGFQADLRRHFAGIVEEATNDTMRVRGYSFVYDPDAGGFSQRKDRRVRVFSLTDAGLIINVLPQTVDLDNLRYAIDELGLRIITDDRGFEMNVSEFGALS
jgi:hypothetical protein